MERLSPGEWERLEREVKRGPLAHGWDDAFQGWTLKRVKLLIGRMFHLGYTIQGVWKLLRRHGWSAQVPLRRAVERDDESIEVWKAEVWPADTLYQEAIDRLERCRVIVYLARARLLYGEWLRRQSRRQDSRAQLRIAFDTFSRLGADGFAERARRELLATGETVRKRTVGTFVELTSQEAQIARLAKEGHTNGEIAGLAPRPHAIARSGP